MPSRVSASMLSLMERKSEGKHVLHLTPQLPNPLSKPKGSGRSDYQFSPWTKCGLNVVLAGVSVLSEEILIMEGSIVVSHCNEYLYILKSLDYYVQKRHPFIIPKASI